MRVSSLDRLQSAITDRELVREICQLGVSLVQKNIVEGKWAENSPLTVAIKGNSIPLRDKGILLSSITSRFDGQAAIIYTSEKSAKILHDGGVIKPKSAKYLTIPAGAKTRSLMRKYGATPRSCIDGMKSAGWRVWPYFGTGTPVICASFKDQVPICLFILKRSVTIPARPFTRLPEEYMELIKARVARRLAQ